MSPMNKDVGGLMGMSKQLNVRKTPREVPNYSQLNRTVGDFKTLQSARIPGLKTH